MASESTSIALQDLHTPTNKCFACGPASEYGLRLKSHVDGSQVRSTWQPDRRYETVYGILSGGIVSSLLECQASWATGVALMRRDGLDAVPKNFVTKEMTVQFRRPTPIAEGKPLELVSRLLEDKGRLLIAEAQLFADEVLCAQATVTSVVLTTPVPEPAPEMTTPTTR